MHETLHKILQSTPEKTKEELAEALTDYMLSKQGLGMEEAIEPDVLQKLRNLIASREENLYELAVQLMRGLQNTYNAKHLKVKVLLYDKIMLVVQCVQKSVLYYHELRKEEGQIRVILEQYHEETEAIQKKLAHLSAGKEREALEKELENVSSKFQAIYEPFEQKYRINQSSMNINEEIDCYSKVLLELLHEPHEPEDIELCSQTIVQAYQHNQNV